MNVDVTVCTLVRGRRDHLANLITGLNRQSMRPSELVIAYMQDHPHQALPETGYLVKSLLVPGAKLPLAAARNRAAMVANGRILIFLDVDCIPGPDLVCAYVEAVKATGGCVMGESRYLGPDAMAPGGWAFDALWEGAERHPARMSGEDAEGLIPIMDHGQLWGLSFALPQAAIPARRRLRRELRRLRRRGDRLRPVAGRGRRAAAFRAAGARRPPMARDPHAAAAAFRRHRRQCPAASTPSAAAGRWITGSTSSSATASSVAATTSRCCAILPARRWRRRGRTPASPETPHLRTMPGNGPVTEAGRPPPPWRDPPRGVIRRGQGSALSYLRLQLRHTETTSRRGNHSST